MKVLLHTRHANAGVDSCLIEGTERTGLMSQTSQLRGEWSESACEREVLGSTLFASDVEFATTEDPNLNRAGKLSSIL